MGRDFPSRFEGDTENFSADVVGDSYEKIKQEASLAWAWLTGQVQEVPEVLKQVFEAKRTTTPYPTQDPTDTDTELDCADQVRATRLIASELKNLVEIHRLGFPAVVASNLETSAWLSRLYALIADRTPHRAWTMGALADLQQQIGDGFSALIQRQAEQTLALTGYHCKPLNFPVLTPTNPKYDVATDVDFQYLVWKLSKSSVKFSK